MLRVLLDATAVPPDRRGVGRYVDSLVPALVRAGVELRVACQPRDAAHYGELSGADPVPVSKSAERPATRLVWEQIGFPGVVRRAAPQLLHSPHYTHPLLSRVPLVVTLHDATFFTEPGLHTRVKGPFFRAATRMALRRAACCVVPSQATADELVRAAGAEASRLQVAHLGVDPAVFFPPSTASVREVRARLGLRDDQGYVAFLGTLEPRKNVPALVRGWVAAARERHNPPALVLAGGAGWDGELDTVLAQVPPELTLLRPGYLPVGQLAGLLGGAELVAYPSLGEGFGLPVLEGMACGAAVLTTRRLALPEIGGDAVAYTEPDPASIATALGALLDDPRRRGELAAAGMARAGEFTWDACAQSHVKAYERALQGSAT